MAVDAATTSVPNGACTESKTLELAIDLPHSPGMRVNLHLTLLSKSIILYLTSTSADSSPNATSMGSFVYAMPDRYNPTTPMSTALYSHPSSLDFTTRMSKLLARRLSKPCYLGNSISLSSAAGGGNVEEEMEAFRIVVDTVLAHTSA